MRLYTFFRYCAAASVPLASAAYGIVQITSVKTFHPVTLPLIVAHRGGTGDAPENTLYAPSKRQLNMVLMQCGSRYN